MTEIVNLRRARKEKARRERINEAETNRLRFGRTRAEKVADKDRDTRQRQTLDGKRLEPPTPEKR